MSALPSVSLIMPVRNEATHIRRALEAVFAQDYPDNLIEVIVADGMSTDGTRELVETMRSSQTNLKLVDNPQRIAPTGLNAGLRAATGQIIVRVDGHCEIAPDYVRRCVEHLEAGRAEAVGGPVETVGTNRLGEAIALAMSSFFGVGGSAFRTIRERTLLVDTVPFPAYRRDLIDRVGPFDEELIRDQDDEYNYRLRKLGGRVLLAADVKSRYYSRGSWKHLARQYFQYGYWKVRVLQKHPRQMKVRQFVPALFLAALSAASVLALFLPLARPLWAGIIGAYLLANVTASILLAARRGRRLLHLLPVTFAILHFAYGAGFLSGLARFWNRWGHHSPAPDLACLEKPS